MKKPEPEDCCFGGGLSGSALGTISNGKFSKPGIGRRSCETSILEVTWIDTTAGETFSKMSANDCGAPGGGAKIGAVEAWMRLPPCGVETAPSRTPEPAMAATAIATPERAPTAKAVLLTAIR